ncbi:MAG: c-type cytochrome [Gemmataceae bacterium]|nr:c-type cytochrome [Gemmata sp.]MDW8197490.1 c-type cytochrome [Gemmataceae bacterium]
MRRTVLVAVLCASLGPVAAVAADRPIPPDQAAAKMTVPAGFKVTLFAGEPDIVQPIAFTFDDRGRMWVVECLSYPKWSRDGRGHDRVVILEDTNGDGVHDKKTVFLDNGANLSGIEIGFGGVWLCSLPHLLFVPLRDGDQPGPPQVILDGWNLVETKHNVFNSLTWGPDGWLYGCNGIQSKSWIGPPGTPREKRTYMDCGVWRYHPTRRVFEVVAHGTTNPFGLDFDDHGELFITNCVIDHLFHFVPGGHYERMYGQDANPYAYQLMKSCVDYKHWAGGDWTSSRSTGVGGKPEHSDYGGGHAHSGCAIYLSDQFPPEYRNTLFTCNIHGNRINNDGLQRTAQGMKGIRRPDFLFANDSWFRGVCVKVGPEGALYVSDWCDTGECHNYDKADTSNGRIYRIVYQTAKPFTGNVATRTNAELVELHRSPNEWLVRKARRVLQERAAAGQLAPETLQALRKIQDSAAAVGQRLRASWTLLATGQFTLADARSLVAADDISLRAWGVRGMLSCNEKPEIVERMLADVLKTENSEFVLMHVASALSRCPAHQALIRQLAQRLDGTEPPHLTSLTWYRIAAWLASEPHQALGILTELRSPRLRQNIVRFLLSGPPDQTQQELARLLRWLPKAAPAEAYRVLQAMRESLVGRQNLRVLPEWAEVQKHFRGTNRALEREIEALSVIFGDTAVMAELHKRITDTNLPVEERQFAIELLTPKKLPDLAKTLHGLLDDPALRRTALRALAAVPDAGTPAAILKAYPHFRAEEKRTAVETLASRPSFALELLNAIERGTVPRTDLPVATARQLLAFNDQQLAARLDKVWGQINPVAPERLARIQKWKQLLTDEALQRADVVNGRRLFRQHCASCHKMFGDGEAVGPELTGSQRANLDYILENLIDPSAVVPRDFRVIHFLTTDDRVVAGIIVRETPDAVTIRTTTDQVILSTADIVRRKPTNLSLMPEGLLDSLQPDEVRDLIAYLRVPDQVPDNKPANKGLPMPKN